MNSYLRAVGSFLLQIMVVVALLDIIMFTFYSYRAEVYRVPFPENGHIGWGVAYTLNWFGVWDY